VNDDLQPDAVRLQSDVLVIGGGAAGVAAAAAAGRAGARVVLLERYGFLGGLATTAEVGNVCGLYLRDTTSATPRLVAGGFLEEFASRLGRAAGEEVLRLNAGLRVVPYFSPVFASVADSILRDSGDITLILHGTVAVAKAEGSRLVEVRGLAWNEPLVVRFATAVDCSGEGTVASLAGAEVEDASAAQASALVFALEQVDASLTENGIMELRRELRRAVEQGLLPATCERLALIPGSNRNGRLGLKLNLPLKRSEIPLWQQVADCEREARALVVQLHRFLAQNTESCRKARLASIAPQLGLRSGRRIHGRARLADEDVLGSRKQACGVARGCWPMERWGDGVRPELAFFNECDFYEIPLDCLRAAKLDNLFAAGRCFSAANGAMSSARVIGTALATGWAAGTAAAFQALGRPLDEAVEAIRQQMGA